MSGKKGPGVCVRAGWVHPIAYRRCIHLAQVYLWLHASMMLGFPSLEQGRSVHVLCLIETTSEKEITTGPMLSCVHTKKIMKQCHHL